MEGLIAVSGFWLFWIVALIKFTDIKRAKSSGVKEIKEIEELKSRVAALEQEHAMTNMQLLEMKEGHDFTMKLLSNNEKMKAAAGRLSTR